MEYQANSIKLRSSVEQVQHNATSWIGHRSMDDKDFVAGQTFVAPMETDVEAIEIFPTIVTKPGTVQITVYDFDENMEQWGASLGTATVQVSKDNNGKWIPFNLNGLHLNKGKSYGFKLQSSDTYLGVADVAGSAKQPPFTEGKEWKFENQNGKPSGYKYFCLAFKVDVKAA